MKVAGAAIFGVFAEDAADGMRNRNRNPEYPAPPVEAFQDRELIERFENLGLESFVPFHESATVLKQMYGVSPNYLCNGVPLVEILNGVAIGANSTKPDILRELQMPWGEKKSEVVEEAHRKLDNLEIKCIDDVSPSQIEKVYQLHTDMANVFPVLTITAPNILEISSATGGGGTYVYPTDDAEAKITANVGASDDDLLVIFYHEQVHAFEDSWMNALPYMSKEDFANLLVTQSEAVRKVFDTYFSLPWEKARDFKSGQPLWPKGLTPDPDVIDNLTKRFLSSASDRERYSLLARDEDWERYNRILHMIGKKVKAIRMKESEELSISEKTFIEEYDKPTGDDPELIFKTHMSRCVDELYHYFVGPVQRSEGGLPDSSNPPNYNGSLMTRLNIEIQSARLLVVSSIPREDCIDDPLDSVRNALLPANRLDSDDDFSQEIPPEYSISLTDIPFDPPVAVQEEPEEAPISPSGVDPWGA